MGLSGTAFFVDFPRTIQDLMKPHQIESETPFEVVKTITLSPMSYENFCTDLLADRQFLEDNAHICSETKPWKCLFVQKFGARDGVLVIPDGCYVKWAAYMSAKSKKSAIKNQRKKGQRPQTQRICGNLKPLIGSQQVLKKKCRQPLYDSSAFLLLTQRCENCSNPTLLEGYSILFTDLSCESLNRKCPSYNSKT